VYVFNFPYPINQDQGQYSNGYQGEADGGYDNMPVSQEDLALVDSTGYSKKYQPGNLNFDDDNSEMVIIII